MTKLQTRNKFCVTMWLDTSTRVKYQKKQIIIIIKNYLLYQDNYLYVSYFR